MPRSPVRPARHAPKSRLGLKANQLVVRYFTKRFVPPKLQTPSLEVARTYALHAKAPRLGRSTISDPKQFTTAFRSAERAAQHAAEVFHSRAFQAQLKVLPKSVQNQIIAEYRDIIKTAAAMRHLQKRDITQHHQTPAVLDRRTFDARLRDAIGREAPGPFSVSMLDLDNFKSINGTFGHGVGDVVLDTFAKHLSFVAKRNRGFAGRVGGEEFQLYLPVSPEEHRKIMDAFRRDFRRDTSNGGFARKLGGLKLKGSPQWKEGITFTAGLTGESTQSYQAVELPHLFSRLHQALSEGKKKQGKANTFEVLLRA